MDEPIRLGDLVMVVHTHCDSHTIGGKILTVLSIKSGSGREVRCPGCNARYGLGLPRAELLEGKFHPLAWLKRIDPLTEPETVEHREEVTA